MLNVIIPCYNAEKTIERTLSSLVAQTNKKFITTVINDCSTDNSLEIIKTYSDKLKLRIINLEVNGGVGNARQVGLDTNECDLVCFLDSDDMFMPHTVDLYLNEMQNDFPEVLYTDFFSEQKRKYVKLRGKENITWFHGKCYRKDFLEKYNIKMPPVRYNEDSGFSTIVNELAEKKVYVDEVTYFWSENPNSLTRSSEDFNDRALPNFIGSLYFAFDVIDEYKEVQLLPVFYGQLRNFYCYYQKALFLEKDYAPEVKKEIQKFFARFWIEEKIRVKTLLYCFNQPSLLKNEHILESQTMIDWLSEMSGINYTPQDFRWEEKDD